MTVRGNHAKLGPAGLERGDVSACDGKGLRNQPSPRAAESGAVGARNGADDAELRVVLDAWPTLPATVKASIVAMVKAARGE